MTICKNSPVGHRTISFFTQFCIFFTQFWKFSFFVFMKSKSFAYFYLGATESVDRFEFQFNFDIKETVTTTDNKIQKWNFFETKLNRWIMYINETPFERVQQTSSRFEWTTDGRSARMSYETTGQSFPNFNCGFAFEFFLYFSFVLFSQFFFGGRYF